MGGEGEMPPDPFKDLPASVAAAAIAGMEAMETAGIFAVVAAYRAKMIEVGFSEAAAEAMAVDYHRSVMEEQ